MLIVMGIGGIRVASAIFSLHVDAANDDDYFEWY